MTFQRYRFRPDGLTERQFAILTFIAEFIHEKQYSPSYREIATEFGFNVHGSRVHVDALETKGVIKRVQGMARTISITNLGRTILGEDE